MGQLATALIEHHLTTEELLEEIPLCLKSSLNDKLAGDWHWTPPIIDIDFLMDFWAIKMEDSAINPWAGRDLPFLEKGNLSLYFGSPNLAIFNTLLRWSSFIGNEEFRKDFCQLTKDMSKIFNASDLLIIPTPFDVDIEDENFTIEFIRNNTTGYSHKIVEVI